MKKIIIAFAIIVLFILTLFFLRGSEDTWLCQDGQWIKHGNPRVPRRASGCGEKEISNFDECVKAGYPVLESYPRQCQAPDSETFTEEIGNGLEKTDLIVSPDLMTVKIFLSDPRFVGEPYFDCSRTVAVERQVPKTQAVARAALTELLLGPTPEEKSSGLFTNINPGVKIQNLTIENGTARVDFDQQLEFQMGGSCRVAAVRAQITETLKQFPTVDNVIISVDGRSEDILQP